jgi:hypothetical protein
MTPDWQRVFPDRDHRPAMGLRRGEAGAFWQDWDTSGSLARQRQQWLQDSPSLYAASLAEAEVALAEAMAWRLRFSERPEPDWVLLAAPEERSPLKVIAGEVVFPSAWSLPEKLGKSLPEVHGPVPDLETKLGSSIAIFFQRLEPGPLWLRENWGLAANAELNHHPSRQRPRLSAEATLDSTWLRLEHQCLLRLRESSAVLFGIRVTCHRLSEIADLPGLAPRLHRALSSMTGSMAAYKSMKTALPALLAELEARP